MTERVAAIPEADRIRVYHSVNEATRTDKRGTLPAEWTEMAGAVNVSLDQDLRLLEDKYFASLEQILLWNPDVIIVNEDGVTDYILENPQWSPLKAVKQGKVYQMPNGVSRWGHPNSLETPLALVWTADLLYPELFADVDLEEMTRGFYRVLPVRADGRRAPRYPQWARDAHTQELSDGRGGQGAGQCEF